MSLSFVFVCLRQQSLRPGAVQYAFRRATKLCAGSAVRLKASRPNTQGIGTPSSHGGVLGLTSDEPYMATNFFGSTWALSR